MLTAKKLLVLLAILLVASQVFAQAGRDDSQRDESRSKARSSSDRSENRSRGRGRDDNRPLSADEIAQRVSRTEEFLKRLDTNGNGRIDADEVADGPGKFMIERVFSRMGAQPHYPITISDLKQSMENNLRTRGTAPPSSGSGPPPSGGTGTPAFGPPGGPSQMPSGMGPPPSGGFSFGRSRDSSNSGGRGSSMRPSANIPVAGPPAGAAPSSPGGGAAAGTLPGVAKPGTPAGATPPVPGTPATATTLVPRKPARFLTAWERLPKDLPDWFYDKDADGDGQVTMAEFSSHWTPETATEFNRYDLNRDGIITAAECLKILTEREKLEKQQDPSRERERRRGG